MANGLFSDQHYVRIAVDNGAAPLRLCGINQILSKLRKSLQNHTFVANKIGSPPKEQGRVMIRQERTFNAWREICTEYFTDKKPLSVLHCGHAFHMDCLANSRKEYAS